MVFLRGLLMFIMKNLHGNMWVCFVFPGHLEQERGLIGAQWEAWQENSPGSFCCFPLDHSRGEYSAAEAVLKGCPGPAFQPRSLHSSTSHFPIPPSSICGQKAFFCREYTNFGVPQISKKNSEKNERLPQILRILQIC